jgi:hypothetical protein
MLKAIAYNGPLLKVVFPIEGRKNEPQAEEPSSDELLNSCWASVPFRKLKLPPLSRDKQDV